MRESLTNLTTKPHTGPDLKKEPLPTQQLNWRPKKKKTKQILNPNNNNKFQETSHHYKTQRSSTKKIGQYWKPTANPQKEILEEESNKHKPQISLVETENKFELM